MYMTLKVEGRVIIIVGPKSTGKSGVAKRLTSMNPLGQGVIILYDGDSSQMKAKQRSKYEQDKEKVIAQAIKNDLFTVIVCENVSAEKLKSIISTCQLKGLFRKVQVLKLNLSEELHRDFLKRGHEETTEEAMMADRSQFQHIVDTDYTDINVMQTQIKNPSNLKYEFDLDA